VAGSIVASGVLYPTPPTRSSLVRVGFDQLGDGVLDLCMTR
jgi:hypothetical protein